MAKLRIVLLSLCFAPALILAAPPTKSSSQAGASKQKAAGKLPSTQKPYLEVKTTTALLRGKALASNETSLLLMGQDGRLHDLDLQNVRDYKLLNSKFLPLSMTAVREQLLKELGRDFECVAKGSYLVFGPKGRVKDFADEFDQVRRTFQAFCSVRGFEVVDPEFPLVAIIFPNQKAFAQYAKKEQVAVPSGLRGYYHQLSNRVVLFLDEQETASSDSFLPRVPDSQMLLSFESPKTIKPGQNIVSGALSTNEIRSTIIHETTHQVAFNLGLHSRLGANPKWVVEGLATLYEAPGVRDGAARFSIERRINKERLEWFRNIASQKRTPDALTKLVSGDSLFQSAPLDAYAEAWALSFFLSEKYPAQYAKYLKSIARRNSLIEYGAKSRIEDFKQAFGQSPQGLEIYFSKFIADPK